MGECSLAEIYVDGESKNGDPSMVCKDHPNTSTAMEIFVTCLSMFVFHMLLISTI